VHSAADTLRLVTFDADGTLYADGCHMEQDNEMVDLLIQLMRKGLHVAIVTAAGYPGQPERFEQRMEGLLQVFRDRKLPKPFTDRYGLTPVFVFRVDNVLLTIVLLNDHGLYMLHNSRCYVQFYITT
jgi:hypothetical protein